MAAGWGGGRKVYTKKQRSRRLNEWRLRIGSGWRLGRDVSNFIQDQSSARVLRGEKQSSEAV